MATEPTPAGLDNSGGTTAEPCSTIFDARATLQGEYNATTLAELREVSS